MMQTMLNSMPQLVVYQPAILAIAILCLAILVQSFLAGALGLAKGEEIPGKPLKGDHSKFSFRVLRTYANSTENLSVFIATAIIAILAGVSPWIVNWLVGLHVMFRLVYWVVYYAGIGKVSAGPRTIVYVLGWLTNMVLAAIATWVVLT
jgi:uncharacterized MAPEG superfamily protein